MTDEEIKAIRERQTARRERTAILRAEVNAGPESTFAEKIMDDVDALLAEVERLKNAIRKHDRECTPECYSIDADLDSAKSRLKAPR